MYLHITDDLDVQELQPAMDVLCRWANTWQLSISVNKCCFLNVDRREMLLLASLALLYLWLIESMCDLGVLVTKDLFSSTLINDVVSRAHKRAGAILRTFLCLETSIY